MAKYNVKKVTPTVTNHQGGTAIKLAPELELIGLLVNGLDKRFYEGESERETRLVSLIKTLGAKNPEFVAKALVYTRSVVGQRSVTHVGAVALAEMLSGKELGTRFYSKRKGGRGGIVHRVDDMLEILAYYYKRNPGKPLPNAMKRGFKQAIENSDVYELAKYQGKSATISLVDLVNLVRPIPSEKNGLIEVATSEYVKALKGSKKFASELAEVDQTKEKIKIPVMRALVFGLLKQFNTAEDKQTKSGQEVAAKVKSGAISKTEAVTELAKAKAENWKELIKGKTIGYLALLRNLRNIVTQADDDTFKEALEMLTNEVVIKKSLVFPHQIDVAFEVLLAENVIPSARRLSLLHAVNKAYELAIPNLKAAFPDARTAVVVDTSGSMTTKIRLNQSERGSASAIDKGALIAATLVKGIGADLYHFSNQCTELKYNPLDSVNTIKNVVLKNMYSGGTEFSSIFRSLNGSYDRVFVISDMQGGDNIIGYGSYRDYINKYGQPYIYSIDLCGYGTSMFKQTNKLINIFGYSSDIYEMVKTSEIDPKAILAEIEKIVI